jgi:heme-degrading monooxygenase HmoA
MWAVSQSHLASPTSTAVRERAAFVQPLTRQPGRSKIASATTRALNFMSTASTIARTPKPPYYAVVFTSQRNEGERGYGTMAERMVELASKQPGFLGVESVRGADGFGITVSYWESEEAIVAWKAVAEHKAAQQTGQRVWYADYQIRVVRVEREYGKTRAD